MSYVMEFEDASKVGAKDTEIKYDGFRVVVDPKSLMFIYGMTLNYRYKHILLHR
jgi:iron-sulfur cluster assembly protein